MIRHNGTMLGVRVMTPPSVELGGRTHCRECDVMLPRGADRPFCVDHSPYVARLRREIDRQEGNGAAAAA